MKYTVKPKVNFRNRYSFYKPPVHKEKTYPRGWGFTPKSSAPKYQGLSLDKKLQYIANAANNYNMARYSKGSVPTWVQEEMDRLVSKYGPKVLKGVKKKFKQFTSTKRSPGKSAPMVVSRDGLSKKKRNRLPLRAQTIISSGEMTKSYYTEGLKYDKYYADMFEQCQTYEKQNRGTGFLSATQGQQAVYPLVCGKNDDLYAAATDMNNQTGTSLAATKSLKFGLHKIRCDYKIANATNMDVYMEIYEIEPRLDLLNLTNSPYAYWLTMATYSNTSNTAKQFLPETYDSTPFEVPGWGAFWEVKKIQNIELRPGAVHNHISEYYINRAYNMALFQYAEVGWMRSCGRCTMIVIKGQPVHSAGDDTKISTAACDIDIVYTQTYTYHDYIAASVASSIIGTFASFNDAEAVQVDQPEDITVHAH